jgi:hypothetical protein
VATALDRHPVQDLRLPRFASRNAVLPFAAVMVIARGVRILGRSVIRQWSIGLEAGTSYRIRYGTPTFAGLWRISLEIRWSRATL